ncbi:hypothetical protein [Amycolatopsis sp. NPDC004079]|uniref:hypothetical protein n=1 Tax=Amycolatopsis sp. NPDC004079 TaxID=3154549 RepID=UPI0033B15E90
MDPAGFTVLDAHLMPARLTPYVQACGGDVAKARRLYVWNIEISAAFWGPVSSVEIAFRNAVHRELAAHRGRPDWWNDPQLPAQDVDKARVEEARLQRLRSRSRQPPATADDVVAALSFGFWSSVLNGPGTAFEQNRFWHTCLYRAFPYWHYRPGTSGRKEFTRRVELLRKFRNRIAHHEPLHRRDLARDHQSLVAMAGFIDPGLGAFVDSHSRVSATLARRADAVDNGQCQF